MSSAFRTKPEIIANGRFLKCLSVGSIWGNKDVFLESGSANALLARELAGRRVQVAAANVVARCPNTYILADSSKFGATGMARICGLDDLAGVITNKDLAPEMVKAIRKGKTSLYLA